MEALEAWERLSASGVDVLSALVNDLIKRSFHAEGEWGALASCTALRRRLREKLRGRIAAGVARLEWILARMSVACAALGDGSNEVAHPRQESLLRMLQEQTLLNLSLLQRLKASDRSLDPTAAQLIVATWQMRPCVDARLATEFKVLTRKRPGVPGVS